MENKKKIRGYKGFNENLICFGFHYELGKTFVHEGEVICCSSGFHLCENPLDVFNYYTPSDSRYCIVYGYGHVDNSDKIDSKLCVEKIDISEEIGVEGIVKEGIKYIENKSSSLNLKKISKVVYNTDANNQKYSNILNLENFSVSSNTGKYSISSNIGVSSISANTGRCSISRNSLFNSVSVSTGDYSASTNDGCFSVSSSTGQKSVSINHGSNSISCSTGDFSFITCYGDCSGAISTGYMSTSISSGYRSASMTTGYQSKSINKGIRSISCNTGDCSTSENNGYASVSVSLGNSSSSIVTKNDSIAIVTGLASMAKGALGSWIILSEWYIDNKSESIKDIKAFKVDGINIKEDTFYTLRDGEAVEVKIEKEVSHK